MSGQCRTRYLSIQPTFVNPTRLKMKGAHQYWLKVGPNLQNFARIKLAFSHHCVRDYLSPVVMSFSSLCDQTPCV